MREKQLPSNGATALQRHREESGSTMSKKEKGSFQTGGQEEIEGKGNFDKE